MTAGRKPSEVLVQDKPENDADLVRQDLAAPAQLRQIAQGYGQGRDLINQLLGQAQAFQAAGDLLQTFGVSKLAIIKENKLYKQLAGSLTPNGLELKGTWAEFCQLLGISDEKANQDIANLQAFGEEALEQMQRIGIGYRDMRQFRRLPTDQRTALLEAAKEGGKEALLDLAEELIARQAREKEEAARKLAEAESNLATEKEAKRRRDERINALEDENARLTGRVPTPDLLAADRLRLIGEATMKTVADIEAGLRSHFTLLEKIFPEGEVPNHARLVEQQTLSQIIQAARALAGDFGISLKLEDLERPEVLWRVQGEALFGDGTTAGAHPAAKSIAGDLVDDDLTDDGESEA